LIGVINFIAVPQLPVVALKLSLFNGWTAVSNVHRNGAIHRPDQTTILSEKGEVKHLPIASMHATNVNMFGPVEFKLAAHILRRGVGG